MVLFVGVRECFKQQATRPPLVQRMWLQSDNTVKECRNTYAARIMSSMTMAGVWSTSSQNFLGVGHTHEDVDGVLSLCKAAIDSASCLQTPQDLIRRLHEKLGPVFNSRGVDLEAELVKTATHQTLWILYLFKPRDSCLCLSPAFLPWFPFSLAFQGERLGWNCTRLRHVQECLQDSSSQRRWDGYKTCSTLIHLCKEGKPLAIFYKNHPELGGCFCFWFFPHNTKKKVLTCFYMSTLKEKEKTRSSGTRTSSSVVGEITSKS